VYKKIAKRYFKGLINLDSNRKC